MGDAWQQAQDGSHGMFVKDRPLFHTTEIDDKKVKQLVLLVI